MAETNVKYLSVNLRKLNENATVPTYAHSTDAGADLYASEDVIIEPGKTAIVPTGIALSVPAGYEVQIRPRSGITVRTKLRVQLGTIDAGYHGEIGVIVDNTWRKYAGKFTKNYVKIDGMPEPVVGGYSCSKGTYIIRKGDRIAQAVLAPVVQASFVEVDSLDNSDRGERGYGSTDAKEANE